MSNSRSANSRYPGDGTAARFISTNVASPIRASTVTTAIAAAAGPAPIHRDHADTSEMFSGSRMFGAVVSVTVRNHAASWSRLPVQPYTRIGSASPAAMAAIAAASAPTPTVAASQGASRIAYGFTNVATPTTTPATPGAPRVA